MIELSVDQQRNGLKLLAKAMAEESDGKALKQDLAKRLRTIMNPLRLQVIARLMSTGGGKPHPGESLRQAVAKQTRAGVRFSGRNVGVNIVQRARGMPRNFPYAGNAMNSVDGWNPTTLGGIQVHQQVRPVEWFDQPARGSEDEARRKVQAAMEDMATRLANRTRKGE